jgi:cell division protein FtsW (lipid II flippase)
MTPSWIAALRMVMQTTSSTASTTLRRVAYLPETHTDFIFSVRDGRFFMIAVALLVVILLMITEMVRRRRRRPKS